MNVSIITPTIRPDYLHITEAALEAQNTRDFEWIVHIADPRNGFTLPSDFNKLIKKAHYDTILILQDCITIPPDAVENVAALDHTRTAYTYPISKEGGFDWRKYRIQELKTDDITPNMWEIDLASAPKSLFYDVGGFDEEFNKGWSWENVEIAWRAAAAHYKFKLSHATEGNAIDHDKLTEHPFRGKRENNDKRANETRIRAEQGDYKLSYLYWE